MPVEHTPPEARIQAQSGHIHTCQPKCIFTVCSRLHLLRQGTPQKGPNPDICCPNGTRLVRANIRKVPALRVVMHVSLSGSVGVSVRGLLPETHLVRNLLDRGLGHGTFSFLRYGHRFCIRKQPATPYVLWPLSTRRELSTSVPRRQLAAPPGG